METADALPFAVLTEGAAPLERLRVEHQQVLQHALVTAVGDNARVALVLPHRLTTLLTHIYPLGLAALQQVEQCVELSSAVTALADASTVVYLCAPEVSDVRAIATHMTHLLAASHCAQTFTVLVTGAWSSLCANVLSGCAVHARIHEVALGFVPLDRDLLSLGRERCLHQCLVQADTTALVDCAAALHQLQLLYGRFVHVKFKGELSAFVVQQLMQCEQKQSKVSPASSNPDLKAAIDRSERIPRDAQTKKKKKSKSKTDVLHTLVLLDRNVDLATALATPLTFDALLDELFDGQDGFVTIPAPTAEDHEEEDEGEDEGEEKKVDGNTTEDARHEANSVVVPLSAAEPVFEQVRGLNIRAIAPVLRAQAVTIQDRLKTFRTTATGASAAELHKFVEDVPAMKATQDTLGRIVSLLERVEQVTDSDHFRARWRLERLIMDPEDEEEDGIVEEQRACALNGQDGALQAIEAMVFRHEPLLSVLRLLCLFSVVRGGVPRHALGRLKMQLLRTYGHELVFSFPTLERVGLLVERGADADANRRGFTASEQVLQAIWRRASPSPFHLAAEALQVIDVDVDVADPQSPAFVTSGYAPISTRLVEAVLKHDGADAATTSSTTNPSTSAWQALSGAMQHLEGPRGEVTRQEPTAKKKKPSRSRHRARVLVVCIIGGVTYAEMAALRWLAQFHPYKILIASTSVINGNTFLQGILEHVPA